MHRDDVPIPVEACRPHFASAVIIKAKAHCEKVTVVILVVLDFVLLIREFTISRGVPLASTKRAVGAMLPFLTRHFVQGNLRSFAV